MFSTIFVPLYILLRFPKYLVLQDYFIFILKTYLYAVKKMVKKKKKKKREKILSCDWDTWCKPDAWLGGGKELMTAYMMSSWWGAIFDKSHREGHYNESHYFIQKELFYGPGGYSMGYHQGGHYFCKGS